ncbi:MAG: AMP-binding protein [Anaerolineae bacterium]
MDKPWLKSYEAGVPEDIPYPEGMLLHHLLEQSAARFPNRPATILPAAVGRNLYERRLSFRDLERLANRFANGLRAMGVQKGDRVALLLPNSPQFVIAYFGVLKMGAIAVALDPLSSSAEIESHLIDCAAETVVTMSKYYPTVKQVQANTHVTRVVTTHIKEYFHPLAHLFFTLAQEKQEGFRVSLDRRDYSFRLMLQHSPDVRPQVSLAPDDAALLQYTRGSNGAPLGAILTHRNIVSACLSSAAWRPEAIPGREAALCISPFFEPYGMLVALLTHVLGGGALILLPKFDLAHALAAIDKYRPTVLPGIPSFYASLVHNPLVAKHNLHSIQVYLGGSGPVADEVHALFEANGGQLVETFGIAEAVGLTHANPIHGVRKAGSIGLPVPGIAARIVDSDFPGRILPIGGVGALALQGASVFKSYWNRQNEANKRFYEGWLVTSIRARMDEDGFFYVV